MGTQIEAASATLLPDRPKDVNTALAPTVEVKSAWACAICGAQKTPMRRNHAEYGPKSVCNACGVREARRNKLADKTKGGDASNNVAGHRSNAKPYRTQTHAADHDSALQPNRTRPMRKPSARVMESMAHADSVDMQPRQRRKLNNHENRVHVKQRQSEPPQHNKDGLGMHAGNSRLPSNTGDAFYYPAPPSSAGTSYSNRELSMSGSMDQLGHMAPMPPHQAPGSAHAPSAHHLLAPEDREWLYEFNVQVAHGDRRTLSFGSNSDQSSGSDVTAFAAPAGLHAPGDAHRPVIMPVSEVQFCRAFAILDQCFGGLSPEAGEPNEAAVHAAMTSAPGLPDWSLSRHIYAHWRQKRGGRMGQRLANAPYRPSAFAASDVLGVPNHSDGCVGARGDNFSQGKEAVPAKVLASAIRRTSSTIDLPQGAKGEKVVQALDDTGILHYRGTQRAYVGTAVHAAISNVNKAASAAFVQPKRHSGDPGWTSDLTIAGPHVLHAQHLDDNTDVHETLLGASLVISRSGERSTLDNANSNALPADAHSVPGECTRRAASDGVNELTPRMDALLNTGAPEMTFIVNDTPVEQRWQQIRERMRSSDVARRAQAPLPPSHAPPEASSPRMPSRPPVAPALKAQMALPPGHMVRVPATSGPDGLPTSGSIEPQYLAMVPRSKISELGQGGQGNRKCADVPGSDTDASPYSTALPQQLSAAALLRDSLPLRPSSVPPQGTPGTSFAMQCMQHPILRVSMSTVQSGPPPRSAVNSTAGDCS